MVRGEPLGPAEAVADCKGLPPRAVGLLTGGLSVAEEPKKIIVDDDWKAEARREKERLAQQMAAEEKLPEASLVEIINLIAMQAIAALGLVATPDGRRLPPDLELAKHYVDLLQVLDDKTRGNLTPEEKKTLDQVLYEMRMNYVQLASRGVPPGGAP